MLQRIAVLAALAAVPAAGFKAAGFRPAWGLFSSQSRVQLAMAGGTENGAAQPAAPDVKDMIKQLEAEGFKVDPSIDAAAAERVDFVALEEDVRKQADAKFDAATKGIKEYAAKMKTQSDEEAKATYEELKSMLAKQQKEAEERLEMLNQISGGMDTVKEEASVAMTELERLEKARAELQSIGSTPEGQLAAFKYKNFGQQAAILTATLLLLLAVDSAADVLAAATSGDSG
mmetsp:Transcript_44032/g.138377  ORF Transcript_44032/g.138377 Transcript_44032/m.138377 type:complete len:231 (+) Transcript_44032:311-1003(+)